MGLDCRARLVVGVSMSKLFTELKENSKTHDEFDKFGKKTGKQFKEDKLIGVLPNGKEVKISERKTKYGWDYNFYDSLGFDGEEYSGDIENVEVQINRADYEVNDLDQMIMGIEVSETDWMNGGSNFVTKVDENSTNVEIEKCTKNLAELFGYTGGVDLYLFNDLSY